MLLRFLGADYTVVKNQEFTASVAREDYWLLVGVVKDDSNGVTLPRAKPAHTMPKVDAIGSPRSMDRPMTHCKRHRVALAKRNHFWPRLHTRPLLGEDELTAREIPLRFRQ
jgi:hypothetical protein